MMDELVIQFPDGSVWSYEAGTAELKRRVTGRRPKVYGQWITKPLRVPNGCDATVRERRQDDLLHTTTKTKQWRAA